MKNFLWNFFTNTSGFIMNRVIYNKSTTNRCLIFITALKYQFAMIILYWNISSIITSFFIICMDVSYAILYIYPFKYNIYCLLGKPTPPDRLFVNQTKSLKFNSLTPPPLSLTTYRDLIYSRALTFPTKRINVLLWCPPKITMTHPKC